MISSTMLLAIFGLLAGVAADPPKEVLAQADNPNPGTLPTLSVYRNSENLLMVAARFPAPPEFTCESWCYESEMDFVVAKPIDGGRIELTHRDRKQPHVLYLTTVTPETGAVDFSVRAKVDPEKGAGLVLPASLQTPNLCWQVRQAPGFASKPDPYPEFVKRCFLFTEAGQTFLDRTTRRPIPCRKPEDEYNNPPWVQMYVGVWRPIPETNASAWADYSPDRYVLPVIGVVSRDGRYLAALANESAGLMCQAWHDCLHNNADWLPAAAPPESRVWRVKVYVMANDPKALIARVEKDFPAAKTWAAQSVAGR